MDGTDYIGRFRLTRWPKLELLDWFADTIDEDHLSNSYSSLELVIKKQYMKYIFHMIFTFCLLVTLFYLGFYFYERIFPLSVTFSVFFVGTFIYASKSNEIKARYFKFFKSYFTKSFSNCCPTSYDFKIKSKKKKFLIFLRKEI